VLTTLRRRAQRDPALPAQEIDLYLSDVQDHLASMAQDLVHFEDSLSRAQSNCLVNIQIQSAEFSNRTNNALSKLTVLGTVLVPLNVITGVWGMNVRVPGQEVDSLFWFTAITSAMACVAFCSFLWARRYLRGETTSSTNSKGH
jgi:magnesium transporter